MNQSQARDAFLAEMARHGVPPEHIDVVALPGVFGIPLHAKVLAATGRYGAVKGGEAARACVVTVASLSLISTPLAT